MTHEYTLLLGGTVMPGDGQPDVSAIAWAEEIVLALGTDDEVRAISRGDSHFVDLAGKVVVPLGETLEIGGPADMAVLSGHPQSGPTTTVAVVRGGNVVEGSLPGLHDHNTHEWQRGDYEISTDPARIDLAAAHKFLSEHAYWATGRPLDVVRRSFANSIVFGMYRGHEQVGLARVVTDKATFAWLCDVYVIEEHRGHGLGKWLIECVLAHPELQGVRRWVLATRDANDLYAQHGFAEVPPGRFMQIRKE